MERKKGGKRESERKREGGRKSGLWSEQGDVLRVFYILHMLSLCPIVVDNERWPHIFRAYSFTGRNDADNRVTHVSVRNKLKSRITTKYVHNARFRKIRNRTIRRVRDIKIDYVVHLKL